MNIIKNHSIISSQTVFFLFLSALIITLSLALNDFFKDLKVAYIESQYPSIIADLIYISVIIGLIVIIYNIAKLFRVDVDSTITKIVT